MNGRIKFPFQQYFSVGSNTAAAALIMFMKLNELLRSRYSQSNFTVKQKQGQENKKYSRSALN